MGWPAAATPRSSTTATPGVHILAKASGADRFVPTPRICGVARPLGLATFGGDVYWTQRDLPTVECDGGIELERLPAGSDAPVMLMAADGDSRDGSTSVRLEPRTGGVLADSTHLWIAASHLRRIDAGSGAVTVVSDAPAGGAVARPAVTAVAWIGACISTDRAARCREEV